MELDLKVVDLARDMMIVTIMLSAPVLLCGMAVGLLVSLFQALTSIQEQTLSLVPKMLAVILVTLVLLAPALSLLRDYASEIFGQIKVFGLS
ncbi:flagellar biosynthetic protein FliQ [Engelhardtia mirabilis]|uniref:Flagellar biosynthetic protein FliQ n=1 Tax=Engelhardtia mirabilis TaxID=2528011 RepID=A0A518BSQ6_9BACT|nr:Flagellar biosynthetic protein FliQ [Planctomycetes bacterium Pla133]QDV04332.1 Flagellar biosynthetic protein FliQ [Planctomycetes bacterium Pla86]